MCAAQVSLRFCMATGCADSVRHGELLIRAGSLGVSFECYQAELQESARFGQQISNLPHKCRGLVFDLQVGVALSKQVEQAQFGLQ